MGERLLEVFVVGLRNLARAKLRSFLTMLGMIFGVGSVIAMLSVGAGAEHEILSRIQELGIQNVIVNSVRPPEDDEQTTQSGDDESIDRYGLTFRDEDVLRTTCPTIEGVLPVNVVKKRVWYGSRRVESAVLGVKPEHLVMFGLGVTKGRTFTAIDSATEAKVCIVRRSLARELKAVVDPIGMTLKIGGYPFEVIGVLEDDEFRSHTREALAIDSGAQEVYIPYTTSMRTFGTLTYIERGGSSDRSIVELDQMIVKVKDANLVYPTSKMIAALLGKLHKRKDYEIIIPLELLEQKKKTQAVFNVVMVLIAAISLIVGGIGIANIMLATITERTKEIGIRRALGARRSDIMLQFLTETAAIGIIGGLFGCLFGLAAIEGLHQYSGWPALVAPSYFGISLGISCAVAVISGIYPARRASLMDPITALRYE